ESLDEKRAGYGARIGFDAVLNARDMRGEWDGWRMASERAVEFLDTAPQQPFLLQVGFSEPHGPFYDEPEDENPDYCLPPPVFPDTPETRKDMASYRRKIRLVDQRMGEVLDALERNNLADHTLVIATTDHGIDFPEMKCTLKDYGTGVFLIMRMPRGTTDYPPGVFDTMVSHLDLVPTICDMLGIFAPDWVEGASLLPLLRGEVGKLHDELFSEVTYHAAYEPMRAIRTDRWKYIRRFDEASTTVGQNRSMCRARDLWLEHGYNDRPVEHEQLYDLMFDPQEMCNLAGHPGYQPVKAEMAGKLRRWMEETDDPLMSGPVPLPVGGFTGRPGTIHPGAMEEKVPAEAWNRSISWQGWEDA
ncbi:MAG: sulfatase-like hydrolase/transferase, partial [Kiritimatiellia bacterium]